MGAGSRQSTLDLGDAELDAIFEYLRGRQPAMAALGYLGTRMPRRDGTLARVLGAALVACGLWTAVVPIAALSGRQEQAHQHMALMR